MHLRVGGRAFTDEDVSSSLLYPKVFADYVAHVNRFGGAVTHLPTPAFWHGLVVGQTATLTLPAAPDVAEPEQDVLADRARVEHRLLADHRDLPVEPARAERGDGVAVEQHLALLLEEPPRCHAAASASDDERSAVRMVLNRVRYLERLREQL